MSEPFEIWIPVKPIGKGRPRIVKRAHLPYPVAITPDATVSAENAIRFHVAQAWQGRPPMEGPLVVHIHAIYLKPKGAPKARRSPEVKPDWDNVGKLVCDALNGLTWRDDAQIVEGTVRKDYGEQEGIMLRISQDFPCSASR